MLFDIISTIEVDTVRYSYSVLQNGSRNIDSENSEEETLIFKFDSISIEHIIFREGPPKLRVDNKIMYFGYKQGMLKSIHFESENYLWLVVNFKDFLSQCREAYLRQKITERFLCIMDQTSRSETEGLSEIIDEFEISSLKEDENDDYLDG